MAEPRSQLLELVVGCRRDVADGLTAAMSGAYTRLDFHHFYKRFTDEQRYRQAQRYQSRRREVPCILSKL